MIGPILFVLTCAGLLCLVRGLVGRRTGDDPRCARCRYDLSGVEMETDFCPECGSAIGPAGSVVVGRRRPLWLLVIVGAVFALMGLGGAALNLWAAATGFDWIRTRSFTSLIGEPGSPLATREADELLRRLTVGELTRAETDRLVGTLADQPSQSALWLARVAAVTPLLQDPDQLDSLHAALIDAYRALGEDRRSDPEGTLLRRVIESEYASGRMSRQGAAYFKMIIDIALDVDPIVASQPAPVRYSVAFRHLPTALSSPRQVTVEIVCRTEGFELDFDGPTEIRWDLEWHVARARGRDAEWTAGSLLTNRPPGDYDVEFAARVVLREAPIGRTLEFAIPIQRSITVLAPPENE